MLKYSKFKKALYGYDNFVFVELEDGMGAAIDLRNRIVELKPFEDSRVYYSPYTDTFNYPNEEHIKGAKEVLENPKEVYKGLFYDEFYDKNSDVYKDVQKGVRLI